MQVEVKLLGATADEPYLVVVDQFDAGEICHCTQVNDDAHGSCLSTTKVASGCIGARAVGESSAVVCTRVTDLGAASILSATGRSPKQIELSVIQQQLGKPNTPRCAAMAVCCKVGRRARRSDAKVAPTPDLVVAGLAAACFLRCRSRRSTARWSASARDFVKAHVNRARARAGRVVEAHVAEAARDAFATAHLMAVPARKAELIVRLMKTNLIYWQRPVVQSNLVHAALKKARGEACGGHAVGAANKEGWSVAVDGLQPADIGE